MAETDHDVVAIGSGYGGSVAALRLAEKGYRVHVYEAGDGQRGQITDSQADLAPH